MNGHFSPVNGRVFTGTTTYLLGGLFLQADTYAAMFIHHHLVRKQLLDTKKRPNNRRKSLFCGKPSIAGTLMMSSMSALEQTTAKAHCPLCGCSRLIATANAPE